MPTLEYVKKPVKVRAWQLPEEPDHTREIPQWVVQNLMAGTFKAGHNGSIVVTTNHGPVHVKPGEWLLQSGAGEYYPCTDEVFKTNYVLAPTTARERVTLEKLELQEKLAAVEKFITSPEFAGMPKASQDLFFKQVEAMQYYESVLTQRLTDLG